MDHGNFREIKTYFDSSKVDLYSRAEQRLLCVLNNEFGIPLNEVDGRSLSAVFRRFEFIEKVLGISS